MTYDPIVLARLRAAAYRCSARLLVRLGEHPAAALLNARADRLTSGVPEALDQFGGAM